VSPVFHSVIARSYRVRHRHGSRVFAVLLYCACYAPRRGNLLVRSLTRPGRGIKRSRLRGAADVTCCFDSLCRAGAVFTEPPARPAPLSASARAASVRFSTFRRTRPHPQSADRRSLDYNSPDFGFTTDLTMSFQAIPQYTRTAVYRLGGDAGGPNLPTLNWNRVAIVAVIGKCFKPLKKFLLRVPAAVPAGGSIGRRIVDGGR
jgi:hypothetical protein